MKNKILLFTAISFFAAAFWLGQTSTVQAFTPECTAPEAGFSIGDDIIPAFYINEYSSTSTATTSVTLRFRFRNAAEMMISNAENNFSGSSWMPYASSASWTLGAPDSTGTYTVKAKIRSACGLATPEFIASISAAGCQALTYSRFPITINNRADGETITVPDSNVTLNFYMNGATEMLVGNSGSVASSSVWEPYSPTKNWTLGTPNSSGYSTTQVSFRSACGGRSGPFARVARIVSSSSPDSPPPSSEPPPSGFSCYPPIPLLRGINLNNGKESTTNKTVSIILAASNAAEMMVSNYADFSGATWKPFMPEFRWVLLSATGNRTVYVKLRSDCGTVGPILQDSIRLIAKVAAITPGSSETIGVTLSPTRPSSSVKFTNVSVTQPEEDVVEIDDSEDDSEDINVLKFRYGYLNNTRRSGTFKIVRRIVLNSGDGAVGTIRRTSARVWMRAGATYKTRQISEVLPNGNYTVYVEVIRGGRIIDSNSFNVTLPLASSTP